LATDQELSDFLKSVEKRAFKRTAYAVHDDESALDIVQDAMIRLAEKYADRPAPELPLIFARILSNATMDWFRRRKVRQAVVPNFSELESAGTGSDSDLLETLLAVDSGWTITNPSEQLARGQTLLAIDTAVAALPARQREAFLLRYWEELDVSETASVMGCSVGSVKTHCARAVRALSLALANKGLKP
jgi:RNA polymerase sigma-70 factor (ECF subfamily)